MRFSSSTRSSSVLSALAIVLACGAAHTFTQSSSRAYASDSAAAPQTHHARFLNRLKGAPSAMIGSWRAEQQADGSIQLTNTRSQARVTHFPDGSSRTEAADGRVRLRAPDGTIEQRRADGSVVRSKGATRSSSSGSSTSSWAAWSMPPAAAPAASSSSAAPAPANSASAPAASQPEVAVAPAAAPASAARSIAAAPVSNPPVPASAPAPASAAAPAQAAPVESADAPPAPGTVTVADNGAQRITLSDGSVMSLPPQGLVPEGESTSSSSSSNDSETGPQIQRVNTQQGDRPPTAPRDLEVKGHVDGGYALKWVDTASDEVGFAIERTPSFEQGVVSVPANQTEFVDPQDLPEARYRVRSLGARVNSKWTVWGDGQSLAANFVVLSPGSGFSGSTPQPAAVGTAEMPGFDAKAIARWDVVPYQTFAGNFHVGVVAFHMNGIDRVDFSVNGGPWKSVREMQLNPRTNVWEYTAIVKASDFPDGPVEVRAIAYPKDAGVPRVLAGPMPTTAGAGTGEHSMPLYANSRGTLNGVVRWVDAVSGSDTTGDGSEQKPFATIYPALVSARTGAGAPNFCSFSTIYLKPGEYNWSGRPSYGGADATTPSGWVTVTAAPGVDRQRVKITSSANVNNPKATRVRLRNLTITATLTSSPGINQAWWVDGCELVGAGRTVTNYWILSTNAPGGVWATDSLVRDTRSNIYGCRLQRNMTVRNIGESFFLNNGMMVNSSVDGIDKTGTSFHPDILHLEGGTFENIIAYGLLARNAGAQGIFSRGDAAYRAGGGAPDRNIAIVNMLLTGMRGYNSSWEKSVNHLLLWQITQVENNFNIVDEPTGAPTTVQNLSIRGSVFPKAEINITGALGTTEITENHFLNPIRTYGTNATSGGSMNELFMNPQAGDFRPRPGSALHGRHSNPTVLVDAMGTRRGRNGCIGALEQESE